MNLLEHVEKSFKHRIVLRAHEIVDSGREPFDKIAQLELEAGDQRRRAKRLFARMKMVGADQAKKLRRLAELRLRAAGHLRATAGFVRHVAEQPLTQRTMPTAFADARWRVRKPKVKPQPQPSANEIPFMEYSS